MLYFICIYVLNTEILSAGSFEHNKYDAEKAWHEHQERMKEIERR